MKMEGVTLRLANLLTAREIDHGSSLTLPPSPPPPPTPNTHTHKSDKLTIYTHLCTDIKIRDTMREKAYYYKQ